MRSGNGQSVVGSNWRALTRQPQKSEEPAWLSKIKAKKGSISARHIAMLAKDIQDKSRITVLLANRPIQEAGLISLLGNIPRLHAFQALIKIAECGRQESEVTVALEDAVSLNSQNIPIDISRLTEILELRESSEDLGQAGLKIVRQSRPLHELPGSVIFGMLKDSDLPEAIDLFAEVWDGKPVTCEVAQVLEAVT